MQKWKTPEASGGGSEGNGWGRDIVHGRQIWGSSERSCEARRLGRRGWRANCQFDPRRSAHVISRGHLLTRQFFRNFSGVEGTFRARHRQTTRRPVIVPPPSVSYFPRSAPRAIISEATPLRCLSFVTAPPFASQHSCPSPPS